MKIIVSVDKLWQIGKDGELLHRIGYDMRRFKELTLGKVVIMGRKTFESLPGSKPLNDRLNIVLTRDTDYNVSFSNVKIVHSRKECMDFIYDNIIKSLPEDSDDGIFVIGGSQIYELFMECCDTALVTKMDHTFPLADTFFPVNLDESNDWELVGGSFLPLNECAETQKHPPIVRFGFFEYKRVSI